MKGDSKLEFETSQTPALKNSIQTANKTTHWSTSMDATCNWLFHNWHNILFMLMTWLN